MAVVVRALRRVCNCITACCILFMIVYCLMHVFENEKEERIIHAQTKRVQESKPQGDTIQSVQEINGDIIAWIELEDTHINQPIVQGKDNDEYLQKNIYGEYSLAGSLFMDVRCERSFTSFYELVYGHHMSRHEMLADLDSYLDESFFLEKGQGTLLTAEGKKKLIPFAVSTVQDDDAWIFHPDRCNENKDAFIHYVKENALYTRKTELPSVLALSTCSNRAKRERIVVLFAIEPM